MCDIIVVSKGKGFIMIDFLSGKYTHQLDDRGRIRIPSKFKDILGANPFVTLSTQGSQNCLLIYSYKQAEKTFFEKFASLDEFSTDPELEKMREISANSKILEQDKQGRIALPQELLDKVNITKNIVSIGMLNRVEIWGEEEYEEHVRKCAENK